MYTIIDVIYQNGFLQKKYLSNTNPDIHYAMRSPFFGKHINECVIIEQCLSSA